jgi:hypothetical protein
MLEGQDGGGMSDDGGRGMAQQVAVGRSLDVNGSGYLA